MVKFGKEFRKYQIKQWKDYYINYKLLKQEIRSIRANIDRQKAAERGTESSGFGDLGHPSLRPMELVEEDFIIQEGQDLESLYKSKYGMELKNFIGLLEKEFRKCYIHFVNQEKELYKMVNSHCYCSKYYKEYNYSNILEEAKEISLTVKFAKKLNCFVNDNVLAMKKILKKFDKKYQRYFGIVGPKYIMSHLTSQNTDLEYFLQFKVIDESSAICENNINMLIQMTKNIKSNPQHIENEANIDINQFDRRLDNYKKKIYKDLDDLDELTYFKVQYREWFYYAKQNDRIVKNNPTIYENDIYNPVLSSTYVKDSILEKCISNPNAIKEIKKNHSPLSFSNKTNLILLYIHSCIYGTMITNIFPLIPNYFDNYVKKNNFKTYFLLPLIVTYIAYLIPYTIFVQINYLDKRNTFMNISFLLSYILIFISSIILIFVPNSKENKGVSISLIIISRFIFGLANNKMMSKKYITLYLPKFILSSASKIFILSELIGEIIGPLISLIFSNIAESDFGIIQYTQFNCIGWYGASISLIMAIIHLILFTKPLSNKFLMVTDERNISGNKYYQKSEKELNRKQYQKEQNLMYKKQYHSIKKTKSDNLINEDKDDINNLIIRNNENSEEINNSNEIKDNKKEEGLKEYLIETKDDGDKNTSFENEGNSLDVSSGLNIALTVKQKNMINTIEKVLEKKNTESNFDDMNQISRTIKDIINNERNKFGYINQNILLILIIFAISSLSQIHLILNYIYYIQENLYSGNPNLNMFCLLIFLLFLPQICKLFFIIEFYEINYKFKIFIFGSVVNLLLVNIPLMFELVYDTDYAFIILNILLVLGCNIINLSCSCYLTFIMSPDWKFLGSSIGPTINYSIIIGKIIGGIISLIFGTDNYINHWIWMGITIAFFVYIFILIFFTRIIRIKGISRIIRKKACENNEI